MRYDNWDNSLKDDLPIVVGLIGSFLATKS